MATSKVDPAVAHRRMADESKESPERTPAAPTAGAGAAADTFAAAETAASERMMDFLARPTITYELK